MSNKQLSDEHMSKIFEDTASLTKTLQSGIDSALLKHKQAGNPVCEWRDDKVVWIPASRIPVEAHKKASRD